MQRAVWGHRAGTASSAGEEEVVRPGEERAEERFEDNAPPPTYDPYQSPSPWYERWKLPGWFKKWLSARKALGNTSIQARPWGKETNRYSLSTKNPNWAQRGLRWLKAKWPQWFGQEPPAVLDKMDAALRTGGPYAEEASGILDGFGLKPGGGYAAETIKGRVSGSVLEGALKPKALGWSALLSVAQNVITYGFGSKRHLGIWSPEFVTSTVVDFGVNTALGLAAAGLVAIAVLALPVEWSVTVVGFLGLGAGFAVSWVWNLAGGSEWAEGIKQRWAQEIRRAGQGTYPDTDDLLEDWPDTPDNLAP